MVLHNSKWDKKATKAYNRKHGIQATTIDTRDLPESEEGVSEDVTAETNSPGEADGDEKEGSQEEDHGQEQGLPSNAWRYADFEVEEEPLPTVARPPDGGLSKYLTSTESSNLAAVSSIFASDLAPRTEKPKSKIVTYSATDEEFASRDRQIEKLKFAESIRDRYKSATRREKEEERARLQKLPPSVAFQARERRSKDTRNDADAGGDEFFWSEIDRRAGSHGTTNLSSAGGFRDADRRVVSKHAVEVDPDDSFLEEMLGK